MALSGPLRSNKAPIVTQAQLKGFEENKPQSPRTAERKSRAPRSTLPRGPGIHPSTEEASLRSSHIPSPVRDEPAKGALALARFLPLSLHPYVLLSRFCWGCGYFPATYPFQLYNLLLGLYSWINKPQALENFIYWKLLLWLPNCP